MTLVASAIQAYPSRTADVLRVTGAPIDAANLPEYAGRLFDRFVHDPVKERLAKWYRLEGDVVTTIRRYRHAAPVTGAVR